MNERVSTILRNRWFIPTSVGVAAFSGGLGLGYILGKRKAERDVEEEPSYDQLVLPFGKKDLDRVNVQRFFLDDEVESEIDDSKTHHPANRPDPRDIIVEKPAVRLVEHKSDDDTDYDPEVINVIRNEDDGWDYESELSTRTPDNPYIIHQDEFFADEMGYTQTTLTYYAGDDILVDEVDVPIYGYPNVAGELRFGHGSRDPKVVYVRNERLHTEYEILFDDGSYEVEVLGLQIERTFEADDLKHSNHKFKME